MRAVGWRRSGQCLNTFRHRPWQSAASTIQTRTFATSPNNESANANTNAIITNANPNAADTTADTHQNVNENANHETLPNGRAVSDDASLTTVQIDSENKTVQTAVGELPISPLMDPAFHQARRKYTEPKPRKSEYKKTKNERKLARNPYALALATPVRKCAITGASLPAFFLQSFTLRAHPETQMPFFVPTGLESKVPDPTQPVKREIAPRVGPSAYVLARQKLFQELLRPSSVHYMGYKKLLRMSDHAHNGLGKVLNGAIWRSDMDVVVLQMMRRRIVETLIHFAGFAEDGSRKYIVKCDHWTEAKEYPHRGCLIYLGPPEGSSEASSLDHEVPRFSILGGEKGLPVYDFREILGEKHLAGLRRKSGYFQSGSLFLLNKQATNNVQLLVWKLQGYLVPEGMEDGDDAQHSLPQDRHTKFGSEQTGPPLRTMSTPPHHRQQ